MQTDLTAQERAGLVAWLLAFGARLTTRDIMDLTGLTRPGAWFLMTGLSRVLSIYCDDEGKWCKLERCKMGENGK